MTDEKHNEPGSPLKALVRLADQPPTTLPAVLLDDLVPFPGPVVPVALDTPERREAVLEAKSNSGFFLLINRRSVAKTVPEIIVVPGSLAGDAADVVRLQDVAEEISQANQARRDTPSQRAAAVEARSAPTTLRGFSPMGILARLVKVVRLADDRLSALVHLMGRAQPVELLKDSPFPVMRVMHPAEIVRDQAGYDALHRQVRLNLQAFFEAHPTVPDELKAAAMGIEMPGTMADFVAQHLSRDFDERLAFLAELDLNKRMHRALEVTIRELDLLTVGNRISQEIRDKVERHQRDFLLREQLKAIRAELGEEKDPAAMAIAELREKVDKAGLSTAARDRAEEELKRLQMLSSESPEHNVVRSYIEWIASLPWSTTSEDRHDIKHARAILDADHYGLDEVKQRIVEFLAVHQLNPKKNGTLMCLSGPPGVGKTSLGQSIARALGREFYRFSVGGMRDEAEIKGHRRTYISAMPGRILQALRQVKTRNPVIMLDELDKMGKDWRGDPSSALLEVLDPAQNNAFVDHYLDLPFDLSQVMFIATVNIDSDIPPALRDRLELIDLPGYIPEEKLEIAHRYLLPRQRKEHGLSSRQLMVNRVALKRIVTEYTHEAGVRELDRQISKVCRKRAMDVVLQKTPSKNVGGKDVPTFLGPPKIHDDRLTRKPVPGVATGLAWTAAGGDVLFIEAVTMPGKGTVKVTGQLGDVMNESAGLSLAYVRHRAKSLGIDPEAFRKRDLHLHFPAGAVKKDGPSAGITVTTALISLLTGNPIRPRLAMTGEITLRGEVLPVGGIREKVVAARRAGVRCVVVPARNRADVEEIPAEVRESLSFVFADNYEDVRAAAFDGVHANARTGRKAAPARERAVAASVRASSKTTAVAKRRAGTKSAARVRARR